MNSIPMPNVSIITTQHGRHSYIVTLENWRHTFYRKETYATRKEAEAMARGFKKTWKINSKAMEDGDIARCFMLSDLDCYAGKFQRVGKAASGLADATDVQF